MADVEVVEGHPDIPEESSKKLSPGAQARIYRDGDVLEGAVLIPQRGPLELRHLAPGSYVIKDETGGYEEVKILPKVETTAVHTRYSERQDDEEGFVGSAEPGSSSTVPPMELRPNQTRQPAPPVFSGPPELGADVDVPVLGEPGSALIEELPDPDDTPDGNLERLKPTRVEERQALWRSAEAQAVEVGTALTDAIRDLKVANGNRHRVEARCGELTAALRKVQDLLDADPDGDRASDALWVVEQALSAAGEAKP